MGLEHVLAAELEALGAQHIHPDRGGGGFQGDLKLGLAACLWLRSATGVLERLFRNRGGLTREELYDEGLSMAKPTRVFYATVLLSTIVVAIGLLKGNAAVIIGAMVIAPLLSPNLSFALATALSDHRTSILALRTLLLGTAVSFGLAALMGKLWTDFPIGAELLSRTQIHFDSALLAIAAGAAAVLSLTRGISAVLVGVMVAVALIPPLATAGLYVGRELFEPGLRAIHLFAINVVSINLAAHLTFAAVGVAPRTATLAALARRRTAAYTMLWASLLGVLVCFT